MLQMHYNTYGNLHVLVPHSQAVHAMYVGASHWIVRMAPRTVISWYMSCMDVPRVIIVIVVPSGASK